MFLNDIKAGSVLKHIPLPDNVKKIDIVKGKKNSDERDTLPVFNFSSSNGGLYKFTLFDIGNFILDGKPFNEYFIPITGKEPCLQTTFTVAKCEPLLDSQGAKRYPYFCYVGYEKYLDAKKALAENESVTEAMRTELRDSGIKDSHIERYYRQVTIDKPIFHYAK